MTQDEARTRLEQRNLKQVARETGVHYMTIYRFYNGSGCRLSTFEKIVEYLLNK